MCTVVQVVVTASTLPCSEKHEEHRKNWIQRANMKEESFPVPDLGSNCHQALFIIRLFVKVPRCFLFPWLCFLYFYTNTRKPANDHVQNKIYFCRQPTKFHKNSKELRPLLAGWATYVHDMTETKFSKKNQGIMKDEAPWWITPTWHPHEWGVLFKMIPFFFFLRLAICFVR